MSTAETENGPELVAHRLHWLSLLFDIASHVWSYLIPIGLGLLGAARGDLFWTLIAAFFFFFSLLRSVLRYLTLSYSIVDRHLIVRQGLLVRNIRTVPLKRIQNIDLVQNLFHRWLNVAEVKIETAAGTEPEAVLRVLAMPEIDRLRELVFRKNPAEPLLRANASEPASGPGFYGRIEGAATDAVTGSTLAGVHSDPAEQRTASLDNTDRFQGENSPATDPAVTLLAIPNRWLILAGLASNRGLILMGIFLGILHQLAEQINLFEKLDRELLTGWLPEDWNQEGLLLTGLIGLSLGFVLLKMLGVIWYVLRFSGYRLTRQGEDLRISCGLLTRVSATIPRSRIQFISVRQDWIERWFGFCSIRIETAGGSRHQSADESVSGRWFLPVMPVACLTEILPEIRPQIQWAPDRWEWYSISRRATGRKLRKGILLALLIGLIGGFYWKPWGAGLGLLALPLIYFWLKAVSRSVRYARFAGGVAQQQGVINRVTSLTFFEKIQAVRLSSSPFDRKWKMANLAIDTAGAGPAQSRISLRMLDRDFAVEEQRRLREISALHPTVFQ